MTGKWIVFGNVPLQHIYNTYSLYVSLFPLQFNNQLDEVFKVYLENLAIISWTRFITYITLLLLLIWCQILNTFGGRHLKNKYQFVSMIQTVKRNILIFNQKEFQLGKHQARGFHVWRSEL